MVVFSGMLEYIALTIEVIIHAATIERSTNSYILQLWLPKNNLEAKRGSPPRAFSGGQGAALAKAPRKTSNYYYNNYSAFIISLFPRRPFVPILLTAFLIILIMQR